MRSLEQVMQQPLRQIMHQPPHRRAGFIDSMYAEAINDTTSSTKARALLTIFEEVYPIHLRQDFAAHRRKLCRFLLKHFREDLTPGGKAFLIAIIIGKDNKEEMEILKNDTGVKLNRNYRFLPGDYSSERRDT